MESGYILLKYQNKRSSVRSVYSNLKFKAENRDTRYIINNVVFLNS